MVAYFHKPATQLLTQKLSSLNFGNTKILKIFNTTKSKEFKFVKNE